MKQISLSYEEINHIEVWVSNENEVKWKWNESWEMSLEMIQENHPDIISVLWNYI